MSIDPILIFAFIEVESSFNRGAFLNDRNGGSWGFTQLDYATAHDRGYNGKPQGLLDPVTNITYCVKVLQWLTGKLTNAGKYSLENLAAAYNAGLGHVLGGGTDEEYTGKIIAAYARWKTAFGVTT